MKIDRRYLLQAMSAGAAVAPVLSFESAFASGNDSSPQDAGTKLVQMDPNVSFAKQIEHNVAPVVLLSTFLVKPEHVDDFLTGFVSGTPTGPPPYSTRNHAILTWFL
ncbi:MAG TPA: hypothetical protein VGI46_16090 [Candidatus Acidoferrum sp.]|jgi:hypothetical protein